MHRHLARAFSRQSYYEKLIEIQPALDSKVPHPGMPTILTSAALPVLVGGALTAFCPYYNLFTPVLPDIALYTCLYSATHTSFLAGVHIGFGSMLYDSQAKSEDMKYINLQILYPFIVPVFCTSFVCGYWAFPYSHIKVLYSVLGIGVVQLGVLVGDFYYADKRKTIPIWYRDLKMKSSGIALLGIFMLIYGIYTFPELTRLKSREFPKTTQEIYLNS